MCGTLYHNQALNGTNLGTIGMSRWKIFCIESEISSSDDDIISSTWVTAIGVGPGTVLRMLSGGGGGWKPSILAFLGHICVLFSAPYSWLWGSSRLCCSLWCVHASPAHLQIHNHSHNMFPHSPPPSTTCPTVRWGLDQTTRSFCLSRRSPCQIKALTVA